MFSSGVHSGGIGRVGGAGHGRVGGGRGIVDVFVVATPVCDPVRGDLVDARWATVRLATVPKKVGSCCPGPLEALGHVEYTCENHGVDLLSLAGQIGSTGPPRT